MAKDEIGRLGSVSEILRKSTGGMGGVTLSYVCAHCSSFPLEDNIWWVSTGHGDGSNRRSIAVGGVRYVEENTNGKHPTGYWFCSSVPMPMKLKTSKAHAAPQGLCEKLIDALKLLANQQTDGDSPIQGIVTGLHDRSRRGIMDGLGSFIEIDKHIAVDVGHLRRGLTPLYVQMPNFCEVFPEAAIREGADALTLRADEVEALRAFIDTDHIDFE